LGSLAEKPPVKQGKISLGKVSSTTRRLSRKIELMIFREFNLSETLLSYLIFLGPVTKTKNIKTDATKILRPTLFSD
jgi:hypothetical protein